MKLARWLAEKQTGWEGIQRGIQRFEKLNSLITQATRIIYFELLSNFAKTTTTELEETWMKSLPKQQQQDIFEILPNFKVQFPFLERGKKPLTLESTKRRQEERNMASSSKTTATNLVTLKESNLDVADQDNDKVKVAENAKQAAIVSYSEEEMAVAINTKKSTNVAVRRFKSWYKEKYGEEVNLEQISKNEAPKLLKHFFLEIRQTTKENKGKEYEPGTLQTYRNGLRRYFLERQCPPAVDNFDIEKGSGTEFEEVAEMLSLKKKDLKKKGFGNKPNTAQPIEDEDVQKMWESGAVGMHSPRALLRLVWWNNMMHLGMRGFQEQRDCQLEDFLIKDTYIEYNERQTKNRQGDEESSNKRARKYNNKIWKTDGGERDPYQAFIEYLNRRPKGDNVPSCFFLSPVVNPKTNIWYKKSPVGVNALRKMMATIKSTAGIQGKFTNSSGRKTAIQSLRGEFSPLEIAELTGHANSDSISSYSHNPLEKQRRMSNKLAGYTPAITATNTIVTSATETTTSSASSAISSSTSTNPTMLCPAVPQARNVGSFGCLTEAVSGLFTDATFNNSTVNISINLQSNVGRPSSN